MSKRCGLADKYEVSARPQFRLKRVFPRFEPLRAAFEARLDEILEDNAQILLRELNPPDTVPYITEAEIPDMGDLKNEALRQWELDLDRIYRAYQDHPQRFRPLRQAAEERLARAFAGAANQLRQDALGIDRYVWVTREDEDVRTAHATRHGDVFGWADAPTGGHPGSEPNCRCVARPVRPNLRDNVVLAQELVDEPTGGISPAEVLRTLRRLARSGVGLAALAAKVLEGYSSRAEQQRILESAAMLGLDPLQPEGLLAAEAYTGTLEHGRVGFISGVQTPEEAEAAAQASALLELVRPGLYTATKDSNNRADIEALHQARQTAVGALDAGLLRLREDDWASGWVELFPELTDEERRLGELPGLTPAQLEDFRETFPAEQTDLPNSTGSPVPADPTSDIVSTPIPEEGGPNVVAIENPHSIGSVFIPLDRQRHILDGDGGGGGHRAGTGAPGKTEFPPSWSADTILEAIREVAGPGRVDRSAHRKNDLVIVGEVDGVTIEVVVRPSGEIRTGYPISGDGVVRNER